MAEIIVVHGTPGAGKSTHAERMTRLSFDSRPVVHIPAGDRLRDIRTGRVESRFKSQVGQAGLLLDHQVVNGIVYEFISEFPRTSIVLLDGYPRFIEAVGVFTDSIKAVNDTLLGCINLNISAETCMSRLLLRGKRDGEKPLTTEFIASRYADYLNYTSVSIKALGDISPLINVDAEPDVDSVWGSFCLAFMQLIKPG